LLRRCPDNATEVVGEGSGGIPLGVLDRPYSESSGRLYDGEVLVLVTDGVIDVRGPDQQPYGLDRLRQILASAPADAQGVVEAILHDVETFRGDRALPDDLTAETAS